MRKRIVVKIGSSSLTHDDGSLSTSLLREHSEAIVELIKLGHEVILISSGAVAAGFTRLSYPVKPTNIAGKQASAAVGQSLLMQGYTEVFQEHDVVCAQLLLSRNDFLNEIQYRHASETITELLKRKAIPIINENDSTSITELNFGDNDMLSALVSGLVHADYLIILTDVNGLYDRNPITNKDAKKYHFLPSITDDVMAGAEDTASKLGTGGMKSKIDAARTASSLGVPNIFIGRGKGKEKLLDILQGKGDGTYIGTKKNKHVRTAKQWIAFHSEANGKITIDQGAVAAVTHDKKSLLPVGILNVQGDFISGEVVEVLNHKGKMIGKGKVRFSAEELAGMKKASEKNGKQTLEAINRDELVIFL